MSKPTPTRPSASAVPILMRLPDLRSKSGSRAAVATGAEPREAREPECEIQQGEPSAKPVEAGHPVGEQQVHIEQEAASSATSADPVVVGEPTPSADSAPSDDAPASAVIENAATPHSEATANAVAEPSTTSVASGAVAREDQQASEAVSSQADVTNASPAETAEPVTPAAARRQRALERQRRQTVEPPRLRNWWTSHLPVIAIGFLVALVLTIYVGRRNRVQNADNGQAAAELPELEIDLGQGHDSLSPGSPEPGMLTIDKTDEATPTGLEISPKTKSPPLLSAKPKLTETEPPQREETTASEPTRTAARPGNNGDITNPFVTSPGTESGAAAAAMSADANVDYPSTERAAYRPGGRVPREARIPNYPETSTPHLR